MGYRVHTAGEGVLVQWGTAAELDEAFGFEHFEGQEDMKFLVLNDVGNLEAWVMPEDPGILRTMAETIIANLDACHDDSQFLIAFELNEDYEGDLEFFLNEPDRWAALNDNKPFDWLDYAEWHLICPHCGAEDEIVEVDDAQRWNKLLTEDVDFSGGKMFVNADMGDHGDYEFLKFMCTANGCLKTVTAPEVFEIEAYV